MTLKAQKEKNYQSLLRLLGELEQLVVSRFDDFYSSNVNTMMKRSIIEDYELQTILKQYSSSNSELVKATDTGYLINIIWVESLNEEDPIKDILAINKIEDIFWAKNIINQSFLSLCKED